MTEYRTPLQHLFTDPHGNTFWCKREDLLPFSFGGNKARIAQAYMEDMAAAKCDHLLCYGNPRSNLCRILSACCASRGIPCTILSPGEDDGSRSSSANQELSELCGAVILPCSKSHVAEAVDAAVSRIRENGGTPYYIYGNRFGTGRLEVPVRAYVPVFTEVQLQASEAGFVPDRIALACGTGMTAAGLCCGSAIYAEGKPLIHAFSIARDRKCVQEHIRAYIDAWRESESILPDFTDRALDALRCTDDFRGTYGNCGAPIRQSIADCYRRFGIALDGTYTGKAWYALQRTVEAEGICNEQIIFLHTGGTPLFFDLLHEAAADLDTEV